RVVLLDHEADGEVIADQLERRLGATRPDQAGPQGESGGEGVHRDSNGSLSATGIDWIDTAWTTSDSMRLCGAFHHGRPLWTPSGRDPVGSVIICPVCKSHFVGA